MTIKEWNNLPHSKRRQIVRIFYWNMNEDFKNDMAGQFHHNFNWEGEPNNNQTGDWYKLMLKCCTITKEGTVKITITI